MKEGRVAAVKCGCGSFDKSFLEKWSLYPLPRNPGELVTEGVSSDAPNFCSKVIKVRSPSITMAGTLPPPVLRHLAQSLTSLRSPCCEEAQATWRGHIVGVQSQLWPRESYKYRCWTWELINLYVILASSHVNLSSLGPRHCSKPSLLGPSEFLTKES